MIKTKKLSIVIPVYNTCPYLPRCLDSVLIDDILQDLEVIVINDGSTDDSPNLLKYYAQKYPETVVFVDKENGGHGSTINMGLRVATGQYFRVLDSDDWLDSRSFLSFVQQLAFVNEDLIVSPYTKEHVYNGKSVPVDYKWLDHNCTLRMEDIWYDYRDMYFTIHSATFKTEVLRRSGLQLFEKCFYVDMQYITTPIPYVKTVRVLDGYLYRYFIGRPEQSMSPEKLIRNYPQHLQVMRWLIDFVSQLPRDTPENVYHYLAEITALMYYTNADILKRIPSRKDAYHELKHLDNYLKKTAPALFTLTARETKYGEFINKCRRYSFFNLLLFIHK